MPANKNHHYVPRCLLKPFSNEGQGLAINLFNINSMKSIENAPVKGQCSKNYMYGKEPELEKAFSVLEGKYSAIRDRLLEGEYLINDEDKDWLINFIILQFFRTDAAVQRNVELNKRQISDFDLKNSEISEYHLTMISISAYLSSMKTVEELRVCLIENQTNLDFIISDDPSVMLSRFQNFRKNCINFGIQSAGISIYLPISPRLLLLCYDSDIYKTPSIENGRIQATKISDIIALNDLQLIRGRNNFYFPKGIEGKQIQEWYEKIILNRRKSWSKFVYFKKDTSIKDKEKYIRITGPDDLDLKKGDVGMTMVQSIQVKPNRWPSYLKYKFRPKYFEDGSAIGAVRCSVAKVRSLDQSRMIS